MRATTIITIILAAISSVTASRAISLNETCRVSTAIARHFNSNSLYLVLAHDDLTRNHNIFSMEKFYSELGIFAAAIRADSLHESLNNPGSLRPTYILSRLHDVKTYFKGMSNEFKTPRATWLIFLDESTTDLDRYFCDFHVPFDCNFLVARPHGDSIRLVEIHRVASHTALQCHDFAAWSRGSGQLWVPEDSGHRGNFNGISLRLVDVIQAPYTTLVRDEGGDTKVGGFNGDIWSVLSQHLNFVNDYSFPAERKWGSRLADGTWEGLIGSLVRGEADVASSGLIVTPERSLFIRFTLPHYSSTTRMYVRRPHERVSLQGLASPFHASLWLALLASVASASITAVIAQALSPRDRDEQSSLLDEVFFNFGAVFCGQGCGPRSQSTPGRIVCALAYLLGVVALGGYSGFLMSSLAVVYTPRLPFTSLDDFPSDGGYLLGMINGTAVHSAFRDATHGRKRELFERSVKKSPGNLPASVGEGFARVCERDFAFLDIKESLTLGTGPDCEVVSLPQDAQRFGVAFGLRAHTPYARAMDRAVLAMLTGGVMRKIYGDAFVGAPRTPEVKGPRSIGFRTVVPVLTVWTVGVALSLVLLVLEIVAFKFALDSQRELTFIN